MQLPFVEGSIDAQLFDTVIAHHQCFSHLIGTILRKVSRGIQTDNTLLIICLVITGMVIAVYKLFCPGTDINSVYRLRNRIVFNCDGIVTHFLIIRIVVDQVINQICLRRGKCSGTILIVFARFCRDRIHTPQIKNIFRRIVSQSG